MIDTVDAIVIYNRSLLLVSASFPRFVLGLRKQCWA